MIDLFGRQARRELELLQGINRGMLLRNLDLRDVIDNLEVDLAIAKAELRSVKADSHSAWCRKGKVASDLAKAKARAEKVAKTLADLPAALAPMDVAA